MYYGTEKIFYEIHVSWREDLPKNSSRGVREERQGGLEYGSQNLPH